MRYLGIILTITLCSIQTWAGQYTLADLRSLHSENNHLEYFDHALDIPPSKRSGEWQKMTESLGISFLEELIKKSEISQREEQLVLTISNWPLFKNDEFFREKRDTYFIKNLNECFIQNKENCKEEALRIFTDYPHGLKFSHQLAELAYKHHPSQDYLWKFIEPITRSEFGEFYCHRSPIDKVIYKKLITEPATPIHQDCAKSLKKKFLTLFYQAPENEIVKAYRVLRRFKWSDSKIDSYMALVRYLNNSTTEFDSLKTIRQNYQLREQLLGLFNQRDYLPGAIFDEQDPNRSQALVRVLDRHFPEYLQTYGAKCLQYLSGEVNFPKGNPTPHCHSLFKIDESLNLFSQEQKVKYHKHTYFLNKKGPLKRDPRY